MEGVRRGYTLLVLYVMKTIERLGTEPALGILEEAAEEQGVLIADELRRTLPEGLTPLETGAEVYRRFMADAGSEVSVHKKDGASVTFLIRRCPFYEAFLDVGVACVLAGVFVSALFDVATSGVIVFTLVAVFLFTAAYRRI